MEDFYFTQLSWKILVWNLRISTSNLKDKIILKNFGFIITISISFMLLAKPSEIITSITSNTNPTSINKTIKFVGKITKGTDIPIDTKVSYEEFINGILKRKGYASLNQDIIL